MKQKRGYLLLMAFVLCINNINAQCLTNSLVINTGYDPLTGLAITAGANGGVPVPDPHWKVTFETPSIATAIFSTGLIEVIPGAQADIITTLGGWINDPFGTPGGWISCLNSNTYTSDGTGPSGTVYYQTLTRPFRMCSDDSIKFDLYIANDNYISATDVDGVPFGFSQPALPTTTNFTAFTHYTQTLFLTAGTHNLNVIVQNYNTASPSSNPTGLEIYGTVSSVGSVNSLVSESYASCAAYSCTGTCNAVNLPDSLHPCAGDVITLSAVLTGTDSVLSIAWTPATGLSSTTILTPSLTVGTTSSYYKITVRSLLPFNLVANGDFSAGNTGFTSSYTYSPPPSTTLIEGDYSVYTNPFGVHTGFTSMGDHTTGTGNMMIINGGPTPTDVWCETIPVLPNTDYDFSAWIANCSSVTVPPDVPILQFKINGVLIGTPTTISSAPGVWTNFFQVWNSGVNTVATICIYDQNTTSSGNDFAIDDISFKEVCVATDSVFVAIRVPDTTATLVFDTTLCITASPIALHSTPGYASYLWNTGLMTTTLFATVAGTYWVYNNNNCATLIDTFKVHYIPLPVVFLGNDTAFCIGDSLILSSAQPVGSTYLWSTGSTADSIHVLTSGTYWLQVYNGCTSADSIHVLVSPFPIVDLGPDTANCLGSPIVLQSSVSYTTPTYLWNDGTGLPTLTVSNTGSYWLKVTVAGCSSADTVNVTVIYDTFTLVNSDTAICKGKSVQTILTANPAATFQWLPTAGIAASTASSPLITPDTSAMYRVHIYLAGCPGKIDSFYIDVQPNPVVFMGGNQSVCSNDSLHLHASVSPGWYTHYFYDWSPGTNLDDSTIQNVKFIPGLDTKMTLIVTTSAGCIGGDSALITIHPGDFTNFDTAIYLCPGDSVQLKPAGAAAYAWHPGKYLNDSNALHPWVHALNSIEYTAYATSQFNCRDTVHATVTIRPSAVLYLGDSVTLFPGDSFQVHPQTNCLTVEWFPSAGLNNAYISDPVIKPEISTKYTVIGTTEYGCIAEDSFNVYIDLSSVVNLPNAFTPGTGGVNNKLYILRRGISALHYFRIFNRWGNMVYETTNINEGWDGTYNGKPQGYDVYVYQIEAETISGTVIHKTGNVTLIK